MNNFMEQMQREGGIKTIGKVFFWEVESRDEFKHFGPGIAFSGVVYSPDKRILSPKNNGLREMWEGEIIFYPVRKHFDPKKKAFMGDSVSGIITSNWGDPLEWADKPYWEKEK